MDYTAAVITVSDLGSQGKRIDTSGPAVCKMIEDAGFHVIHTAIIPDEQAELQKMLINAAHLPTVTQNDIIVTNVRHYEALSKALEAIHRVQDGLDSQISGDFLSQDIRECIFFISDIAGEVTNDMVLQNIFQHFCVGK